MNISIDNNTGERCLLHVGEATYPLDNKAHRHLHLTVPDETQFRLENKGKNYVRLDLLDIAFGLFFGNSMQTQLCCDYAFAVKKMDRDFVHLSLESNKWAPAGNRYVFPAAYVQSQDALVADLGYTMPQRAQIKKKHFCKHLFGTSLWPVAAGLIALCFVLSSEWIMLLLPLLAVWALMFGGPALLAISGFNDATNPETVEQELLRRAYEERHHIEHPPTATEKAIGNILDKLFVFDKNKDKK